MEGKQSAAMALGAFGLFMCLCTLAVTFFALGSSPVLLSQSAGAVAQAEKTMAAFCREDWETLGSMLYGSPHFGPPDEESAPAVLLWDAYVSSVRYSFPGDCYASGSGVTLDVRVSCLDMAAVTETLGTYARSLFDQRVAEAEDTSEIYDVQNNYRDDFLADLLRDAALQALEAEGRVQEQVIPLHLTYEEEQWWVVPTGELLTLLSGGF